MNKLKVFEAFSGYGSQSLALSNIGVPHEVVATSEIDADAIISYGAIRDNIRYDIDKSESEIREFLMERNIGYDFKKQKSTIPKMKKDKLYNLYSSCIENKCVGDIGKIKVDDIPYHDLFTYSFPCQDISIAGRQLGLNKESGTRSGLLWECEKIIGHRKPKYLLMENVKNLVGKNHKKNFEEWCKWLESQGYTNYWKVLNAKKHGVPQNRERVFMVSILGEHEEYQFLEREDSGIRLKDILEKEVDEKYYMNKPFTIVNKGNIKGEFSDMKFEQTKRIHGVDSHFQTLGAADRGTNHIMINAEVSGLNNQIKRVFDVDGICCTLDTMQGGHRQPKILELNTGKKIYSVDGKVVRKLTAKECFRLMGMTDENFEKCSKIGTSQTQLYKQAGNSIVINVLEDIFKVMFKNSIMQQVELEREM